MLAWHFVGATLRDGNPIPADGEWLAIEPPLVMCERGLHASERLIDALRYAPGNTACRVECDGEIIHDGDKLVCSRRRILWRVEGEALLRSFARRCALDVGHLWDMPPIVRHYLETGDTAARDAARAAAWGAAWGAAWEARAAASAAGAAAWDAQNTMLTQLFETRHDTNG